MNIKYLELNPFAYFLRMVMELLVEQDTQDIFGEPVDPAEVPDYLGEFQFSGPVTMASRIQDLSIRRILKSFSVCLTQFAGFSIEIQNLFCKSADFQSSP